MIAKSIAAEMEYSEIVRISHAVENSVEDGSTQVGLVFPAYYGGLPSLVQKLLPIDEEQTSTPQCKVRLFVDYRTPFIINNKHKRICI